MTDEPDMTVPVTRGEMHQALETWARVIIDTINSTLIAALERTKVELRAEMRAEIGQATSASAEQLRTELRADIASAVGGMADQVRTEIRVMLEPYKKLPERVEKLEDAVFKPKPKRRAKG